MNSIDTGPLIESALAGLTFNGKPVPVAHTEYKGKQRSYIRYCLYADIKDFFADDEAQGGNIFNTIDIFSDVSDYSALRRDVEMRLTNAGFTIGDVGPELFETSTGFWHLPINISYEQ